MTKITQNIAIPLIFEKCYLNFFFSVLNLTLYVQLLGVKGLSICAHNKKFLRVFSCYVFAVAWFVQIPLTAYRLVLTNHS